MKSQIFVEWTFREFYKTREFYRTFANWEKKETSTFLFGAVQKACQSCRFRKMLQKKCPLAKIGPDTETVWDPLVVRKANFGKTAAHLTEIYWLWEWDEFCKWLASNKRNSVGVSDWASVPHFDGHAHAGHRTIWKLCIVLDSITFGYILAVKVPSLQLCPSQWLVSHFPMNCYAQQWNLAESKAASWRWCPRATNIR